MAEDLRAELVWTSKSHLREIIEGTIRERVELPISPDELHDFRPWEAIIPNVTVDKPWHGDVPTDASRNMLKLLRQIYSDDRKLGKLGAIGDSIAVPALTKALSDEQEWVRRQVALSLESIETSEA